MRAAPMATIGIALIATQPAFAADLAAKAQAMIDAGHLEPARAKCTAWGAQNATADKSLREACAQVWLVDAERANTVDGWATFRTAWPDTSWAKGAYEKEAALALSDLGYTAEEAAYVAVGAKYPGTDTAELAHERAAETAVASIKTAQDAYGVVARYPDKVPLVLTKHLGMFIHATVTPDALTWTVEPPLTTDQVVATWSVRDPKFTYQPWKEIVEKRLAVYGFSHDAIIARESSGDAPAFALCYDPTLNGDTPGVRFTSGDAEWFVETTWAAGCGPDAAPVFATAKDGHLVGISAGPNHRIPLTADRGAYSDARALVGATTFPRLDQADAAAPARTDRVWTDAGTARAVQRTTGGDAWLVPNTASVSDALGVALVANRWVPDHYSVTPMDGGGSVVYGPDKVPWLQPAGDSGAISPLALRYLGLDPVAMDVPTAPFPVGRWTGPKGPPGSTPVPLAKGDAVAASFTAALVAVGLDAAALGLGKLVTVDLDGDGRAEVVADGAKAGRHTIVAWMAPDPAVAGSTGRVFAWSTAAGSPLRAVGFKQAGQTVVAWVGDDGPIEAIAADGADLALHVIP